MFFRSPTIDQLTISDLNTYYASNQKSDTSLDIKLVCQVIWQTKQSIVQKVRSVITTKNIGNLVFIVSTTGAGKTTTLAYLQGDQMAPLDHRNYKSESAVGKQIQHSSVESGNFLPNIADVGDFTFVDFPGFFHSNGMLCRIAIKLALRELIPLLHPKFLILQDIRTEYQNVMVDNELANITEDAKNSLLGFTQYTSYLPYIQSSDNYLTSDQKEKAKSDVKKQEQLLCQRLQSKHYIHFDDLTKKMSLVACLQKLKSDEIPRISKVSKRFGATEESFFKNIAHQAEKALNQNALTPYKSFEYSAALSVFVCEYGFNALFFGPYFSLIDQSDLGAKSDRLDLNTTCKGMLYSFYSYISYLANSIAKKLSCALETQALIDFQRELGEFNKAHTVQTSEYQAAYPKWLDMFGYLPKLEIAPLINVSKLAIHEIQSGQLETATNILKTANLIYAEYIKIVDIHLQSKPISLRQSSHS